MTEKLKPLENEVYIAIKSIRFKLFGGSDLDKL